MGLGITEDQVTLLTQTKEQQEAERTEVMELVRKRTISRITSASVTNTFDTADGAKAPRQRICPIHPKSLSMTRWEMFMSVLIIYSVFEIPYRFCFNEATHCLSGGPNGRCVAHVFN